MKKEYLGSTAPLGGRSAPSRLPARSAVDQLARWTEGAASRGESFHWRLRPVAAAMACTRSAASASSWLSVPKGWKQSDHLAAEELAAVEPEAAVQVELVEAVEEANWAATATLPAEAVGVAVAPDAVAAGAPGGGRSSAAQSSALSWARLVPGGKPDST